MLIRLLLVFELINVLAYWSWCVSLIKGCYFWGCDGTLPRLWLLIFCYQEDCKLTVVCCWSHPVVSVLEQSHIWILGSLVLALYSHRWLPRNGIWQSSLTWEQTALRFEKIRMSNTVLARGYVTINAKANMVVCWIFEGVDGSWYEEGDIIWTSWVRFHWPDPKKFLKHASSTKLAHIMCVCNHT